MKKLKYLCSIALLAIMLSPAMGQVDKKTKYEFVKNKSVNKTYTVTATDKLNIANSFGTVEIHTWNKSEIKVDVSIEVSSSKEENAQKILDGITVTNEQSGNEISFKTSMNNNNNHSKNEKTSMSVDYSIYMPENNPLQVSNEFGATIIPALKGNVELTSKFGSLTAGDLEDVKKISVEFGAATIQSINNGKVNISYSKATIGKLSGNITLGVDFSGSVKIGLDSRLTGLEMKTSYSTVNLKPAAGLSASYIITTSFGDLKNKTSIKFESDKNDEEKGPKFDYRYEGKSGTGGVPVNIKDSFGKIILGEADREDMDEGKSKSKTNTSFLSTNQPSSDQS